MSDERDLPPIPDSFPDEERRPLAAMREALQVLMARRGDSDAAAVRWRDLIQGGFSTLRREPIISGITGPSGPSGPPGPPGAGAPTPDLTPPPTVSSLAATAGFSQVLVTWSGITYTEGHGNKQTVLYAVKKDPSDPTLPTFPGEPGRVAVAPHALTIISLPSELNTRWHLWAKFESVDGVLSSSPAGGTNGVTVTTGQDITQLLKVLTGQITVSQLYHDLAAPILQITSNYDDLASDTLAAAIAIHEEAKARALALLNEAGDRGTALTEVRRVLADGDVQLAQSITTLTARVGSNQTEALAAVQAEQIARVAADEAEATARLGWWRAHRFLLLRRLCQFGVLGLFLLGPLAGIWILKGNLSSSLLLETVPLTDPLTLLQSLAAGQWPIPTLWLGAGLVLAGYWLVGGRVFCSWVCPVNLVTDAAAWLRGRLGLKGNGQFNRATRYWLLAMVLVAPAITGVLVWELVNPVSLTLRGLLFGMGAGWGLLAALFLFDLFVVERGWCGHLCPVGAFYALVNRVGFIKIAASGRERCSNCMDCYAVCPERPILRGPVHGARRGHGPLIAAQECTNCGRCIDVCAEQVFEITVGFAVKAEKTSENT